MSATGSRPASHRPPRRAGPAQRAARRRGQPGCGRGPGGRGRERVPAATSARGARLRRPGGLRARPPDAQTTRSQVEAAQAQARFARDQVSFTELHADAEGVVTEIGAEAGEVVQAGQMIVRLAREDGRDAVFDVPAQVIRSAPADPRSRVPDRGPQHQGARSGARGGGAGRPGDADFPGQGRPRRAAARDAPGCHRHRPHGGRRRRDHRPAGLGPHPAQGDEPAVWVVDPATDGEPALNRRRPLRAGRGRRR